jgi:ATP-binding cassette subfamily F protein uup
MALIDLQNISKQFDTKVVLKDIFFTLQENQRVAIIGRNGEGKSTLLKIILKLIEPDSGKVVIDNSIEIKMLSQNPKFKPNITVKQAIQDSLIQIKQALLEYEQITKQIEKDYNNTKLLNKQSELIAFIDHHNAWDLTNKIELILEQFRLKEYEDKEINLLSGGEQRRVALATLLLQKPDVLFLDEPTNHLDVYMVEFLEQLLLKEKFSLIFISHDRYFIDNIATDIIELDKGKLTKFKGGYKDYLEQKQKLIQNLEKEHQNLLKKFKEEAHWMQHGISARRKRNELRKENYYKLKEQIKKNPSIIKNMQLNIDREIKPFKDKEKVINKKKMLFEFENASKTIGNKLLFKNFTTRILQKDKIAIVGKNGCGKSTLLQILLGEQSLSSGQFKKGDFKIGYFDQHRTMLNDDKNLIETFCPNGGDRVELADGKNMHVYGYLKNFLFPKEYLDKKIGVLSGGEKNKVALALLFTKKYDLLILDEPTNDLDIPTINILEEYLINYQGAVIFVSHDRYFVDKIANKIYQFKNQQIFERYEPYTQILEDEKDELFLNDIKKELDLKPKKQNPKPKTKNKLSYKEKLEYDKLPQEIDELESKINQINQCLSDPNCYQKEGLINLNEELEKINNIYEQKLQRYFELEEIVESYQ